jgi:hypothetical protein
MQDTVHLIASIILGCLSLIPNAGLRYAALGIASVLALIYAIYLKHPTMQLRQLQHKIGNTEDLVRRAKVLCPRDHLNLAGLGVQLLEYAFAVLFVPTLKGITESTTRHRYSSVVSWRVLASPGKNTASSRATLRPFSTASRVSALRSRYVVSCIYLPNKT